MKGNNLYTPNENIIEQTQSNTFILIFIQYKHYNIITDQL